MKKFITTAMMLSGLVAYAQDGRVGINTADPKATLDIRPNTGNALETATTNEGVLIPRLSKTRIANIADDKLVKGTFVYVSDYAYTASPANVKVENIITEGFHYYDGTTWLPVQKDNARFEYILSRDGTALVQWMDKYKEIEVDMNKYPDMVDVENIGTNLFSGSKITKFIIKEGVKTIGDRALYSSPDTEVVLPSTIEEIKTEAFFDNKTLADINLPNLKKVGQAAFERTTTTSVNFPEATVVNKYAFRSNASLKSALLPKLIVLEEGTFSGTNELERVDLSSVEIVRTGAFNNRYQEYYNTANTKLTSISLPKATLIEPNAFEALTGVTTIDMPEAVTIGDEVYGYLYYGPQLTRNGKLTSLNIPKAQTIGRRAFSENRITTLNLANAKIIGDEAFSATMYLNGVRFEDAALTSLNVPLAETIGARAFLNNKLTSIDLPKAKIVGESSFTANSGPLGTLNAPILETIGGSAFAGNRLTTLNLPEARTIERGAFENYYTAYKYNEPNVDIRSLSTLSIPKVETIGENAFRGHRLSTLSLPNVKTIGNSAFDNDFYGTVNSGVNSVNNRTLTSVTIGPNITSIGPNAFGGNSSYSYNTRQSTTSITITIQATAVPTFGSKPFPLVVSPGVLTFRVPSASLAAYKTAIESAMGPSNTSNNYVVVGY